MYPLAVTLAIAAYTRDGGYRRYAVPVAVIGAGLSSYHHLLERVPALARTVACDPAAPCTVLWIWEFDFISIPYMALSAFALIAVLLAVGVPRHGKEERRVQSNPRASVA